MNIKLYKILIIGFIAYAISRFVFPEVAVNFCASIFAILFGVYLIVKKVFVKLFYKHGIKFADKRYVENSNTLKNKKCSIVYNADNTLIVTELEPPSENSPRRLFTLKQEAVNVNMCWWDVCRFFDEYVSFETLVIYFNIYTDVKVREIQLAKRPDGTISTTTQEISAEDILNSDANYVIDREKLAQIVNTGKVQKMQQQYQNIRAMADAKANFVDIKELPKNNTYDLDRAKPEEVSEDNFADINALPVQGEYTKLDINLATVDEISALPGINIILAKKIVHYRDLNGAYKSLDDFFEVGQVKEHFKAKLKDLITIQIDKAEKKPQIVEEEDSRIVDI